jgi:hypothetical protein
VSLIVVGRARGAREGGRLEGSRERGGHAGQD